MQNQRIFLALATALLVTGCAQQPKLPDVPSTYTAASLVQSKAPPPVDVEAKAALALRDRLPKPQVDAPFATQKLYGYSARNLPVRQAMAQFAAAYGLNIVLDADVSGTITVDFRNLPLEKAMEAMLETAGLSWGWDAGLLRVSRLTTKTFTLDYLRLTRAGISTSTSTTSSNGGGGSSDSARVGVTKNDTINYWDEVERQLDEILTKGRAEYSGGTDQPQQQVTTLTDRLTNTTTTMTQVVKERIGRLIVNRLSGTVQVTTSRTRMRAVEDYLESLRRKTLRQVYIDVRIVEVTLAARNALGIDWTRVNMGALVLTGVTGAASTIGGAATLAATYDKTFPSTHLVNDIGALITALQAEGNVRVVSQPRIRTLNNQPAIVKSGTERTFFATTTVVTPVAGGQPLITTTNTPQTITEGVVLSVTPQIADDSRITLDVSPSITRISGVDVSPDGNSNAPRLDIKTTTTMVRVGDGESIVIGGLIEEVNSSTERGIPGLSKVDGIGAMFRTNDEQRSRRELVIILTPYIVE